MIARLFLALALAAGCASEPDQLERWCEASASDLVCDVLTGRCFRYEDISAEPPICASRACDLADESLPTCEDVHQCSPGATVCLGSCSADTGECEASGVRCRIANCPVGPE